MRLNFVIGCPSRHIALRIRPRSSSAPPVSLPNSRSSVHGRIRRPSLHRQVSILGYLDLELDTLGGR